MTNFDNAKPGDKVFINYSSGWGRQMQLGTIEKVGKLHITLLGSEYRRTSGYRAGDSWTHESIQPYDDKEWQDYLTERKDGKMRQEVCDFKWQDCDIKLIRKVHDLLPKKA
jgi:hypothetical protein